MKRLGERTPHVRVSLSPSKIPYVGFSPVRLQTGLSGATFVTRLIRAPSHHARVLWPIRARRWTRLAMASPSRGPWLGSGLCCPAASSLTMASSEPLATSCRLMTSSTGLCTRPVARGSPIYSARLFPPCRLLYPGGPSGCVWLSLRRSHGPSPSPLRLGIRISRALRFPRGCLTGLNQIRFRYGPMGLLALHRPGRLRSSFHLTSHLGEASIITTRVDSQFPRPDLHRQDAQHYGLRAEQAETRSSRERDGLSPSSNRTCRFPASGSPTRVARRTVARS